MLDVLLRHLILRIVAAGSNNLAALNVLDAWRGSVVSSPTCPPTGGCATRVLVKLENVADVTTMYAGPHPVLYSGDFAGHLKTLAKLYPVELRTNIGTHNSLRPNI